MLLTLAVLLLAPALTKDELHEAGFIPQMRDHFGPAAFLLKRPLGQIRGTHILPMPGRDLQVVETRLGIGSQTPAGFRKGLLILLDQGVQASLAFLKRRGIPQVSSQSLERRPGLWGNFLHQMGSWPLLVI
jgi:hypothetical protein